MTSFRVRLIVLCGLFVACYVTFLMTPAATDETDFSVLSEWRDGVCHSVAMSDSILCAQRGNFIDIILIQDTSDPEPILLDYVTATAPIVHMDIENGMLYVAEEAGNVRLVDISDPKDADILGTIHPADNIILNHVVAAGETLYIKSTDSLWAYDVSSPASSARLDAMYIIGYDIAVLDSALYVATERTELGVVNISDPSDLSLVGWFSTTYPVDQVELSSNTLVTGGAPINFTGGFDLFDCSDPHDPDVTTTVAASCMYKNYWSSNWLATAEPYAYFTDSNYPSAIYSLYLTNPDIDTFSTVPDNGKIPISLTGTASNLYVSMYRGGYNIYDLFYPHDPELDYSSDHGGNTYDIDLAADYAFLAQSAGLRIFDISYLTPDLQELTMIEYWDITDEFVDISVDGDRLFCLTSDYCTQAKNVIVYDISDPESPDSIFNESWSVLQIEGAGDLIYLNGGTLIWAYDFIQETYHSFYMDLTSPGAMKDFIVADSCLFAADVSNGVVAYKLSKTGGASVEYPCDELAITGGVWSLALRGNKLLAGANSGDVVVISVQDPEDMEIIGSVNLEDTVRALTWPWDTAYAVDATNTLYSIGLLNPASPSVSKSISLDDEPVGLDSEGYLAFLALKNQGMDVLTDQALQGIAWRNLGPGGGGNFRSVRMRPDSPDTVLAGGDVSGINLSLDGGDFWTTRNGAIATPQGGRSAYFVSDFVIQGSANAYAVTNGGLFISTDLGKTFEFLGPDTSPKNTGALVVYNSYPYNTQWASLGTPTGSVGSCSGLWLGTGGQDYILATTDAWQSCSAESLYDTEDESIEAVVHSFVMRDVDTILASSNMGLFRRDPTENPVVWKLQDSEEIGLPPDGLREMVYSSAAGALYAISGSCPCDGCANDSEWHGGIYKSEDWGYTWEPDNGSESTTNLIINGDFDSLDTVEDQPAPGWQYFGGGDNSSVYRTHPGYDSSDSAMTVDSPTDLDCEVPEFVGTKSDTIESITPGDIYVARFYIQFEDTVPENGCPLEARVRLKWLDGTQQINDYTLRAFKEHADCPMTWTMYETSLSAPLESNRAIVYFFTISPGITFSVDNFELKESYALPKMKIGSDMGNTVEYKGLACDDVDEYLYVGAYPVDPPDLCGVWRKAYDGDEWEYISPPEKIRGRPYLWHKEAVWGLDVQHPAGYQDPVIFFSNGWPYKSTDDGQTWDNMCWDSLGVSYFESHGEIQPVWIHTIAENSDIPEHIYYGDLDNLLNISNDRGETWHRIGSDYFGTSAPYWSEDLNVSGDGVTSIIMDPEHSNWMYCGVFVSYRPKLSGFTESGGVVRGVYDDETREWVWNAVGDDEGMPRGGSVDLAVYYDSGTRYVYAAVLTKGLYKLEGMEGTWEAVADDPEDFDSNREYLLIKQLLYDEDNSRLFILIGDTYGTLTTDEGDGIWIEENGSGTYQHIFTNEDVAGYDSVFVTMALENDGALLVATRAKTSPSNDGGLYLLTKNQSAWSADKLSFDQYHTTSILPDAENSDRIYAFSCTETGFEGTDQEAGVWVTEDGGDHWNRFPINGIACLKDVTFKRSQHTPATFYAATKGNGLFIGQLLPPAAPTELAIDEKGSDYVDLSWAESVAGTGYEIQRRLLGDLGWTTIDTIGSTDSYTDNTVACSNIYEYAVNAFNEAGCSGLSNTVGTGAPLATGINPGNGPASGGTSVTISGSWFRDGATVTFGGVAATNVTVVNCTTITCTTPQHSPGTVDVVIAISGYGSSTLESAFLYNQGSKGDPGEE